MSQRLISESNVQSIIRNGDVRKVEGNRFGPVQKYAMSKSQLIHLQWSTGLESNQISQLRNLAVVAADVGKNIKIITAYRNVHPEDREAMERSVKIGTSRSN